MSKLADDIKSVRTQIADHVQTYPDDIGPWRMKFDELRADLDRLEYAKEKQFNTTSVQPLPF
jgi:hypothetical protein